MITNRKVSKPEYTVILSQYPYIALLDAVNISITTALRSQYIERFYDINYDFRYTCMIAISLIMRRESFIVNDTLLDDNPYDYLKTLLLLIPNKYKDMKGISGLLSQKRIDLNIVYIVGNSLPINNNNEYLCCDTARIITTDDIEGWRYNCSQLRLLSTSIIHINDILYLYCGVDTLENFNKIFEPRSNSLYFDLEKFSSVNSRTWTKREFKDDELRIVSDDEEKFTVICSLYRRYKSETSISSTTTVNSNSNTKKGRKTIPKGIRRSIWDVEFEGKMKGYCFCCDKSVDYDGWECGHILADSKGGDVIMDNLKVLCSSCNRSMGNIHMGDYMREWYPQQYATRGHLL